MSELSTRKVVQLLRPPVVQDKGLVPFPFLVPFLLPWPSLLSGFKAAIALERRIPISKCQVNHLPCWWLVVNVVAFKDLLHLIFDLEW